MRWAMLFHARGSQAMASAPRQRHPGTVGGDEFKVALLRASSEHSVQTVVEKLGTTLAQPFRCRHQLQISASIGVARFPDDGQTWTPCCTAPIPPCTRSSCASASKRPPRCPRPRLHPVRDIFGLTRAALRPRMGALALAMGRASCFRMDTMLLRFAPLAHQHSWPLAPCG